MEKLEVVSPLGRDTVTRAGAAPRLDTLEGKTVCEIWNGVFKGDVTFPMIRKLLQARYHGLEVIPYTEFRTRPAATIPHGSASSLERLHSSRARKAVTR